MASNSNIDEPINGETLEQDLVSTNVRENVNRTSERSTFSYREQEQPHLRAAYASHRRWGYTSGGVVLSENGIVAERRSDLPTADSRGLVFSKEPLKLGSTFEIEIVSKDERFTNCFNIGVTALNPSAHNVRCTSIKNIQGNTWYICGCEMRHNSTLLHRIVPSLEHLGVKDHITLELMPAGSLRVLINSRAIKMRFENLPSACDVYAVVELRDSTMAIQAVSPTNATSLDGESLMPELIVPEEQSFQFSEVHGKNVVLLDEHRSAMRTQSFTSALVFVERPLLRGESISVVVGATKPNELGTIGVGCVGAWPLSNSFSVARSILNCKPPCWMATYRFINVHGKIKSSEYGASLNYIRPGSLITLQLSHVGDLLIRADGQDLGNFVTGLPYPVYPTFDLFGTCVKISLVNDRAGECTSTSASEEGEEEERIDRKCDTQQKNGCDGTHQEDGALGGNLNVCEQFERARTALPFHNTCIPSNEYLYGAFDTFYEQAQQDFFKHLRKKMTEKASCNLGLPRIPPAIRSEQLMHVGCSYLELVKQYRATLSLPKLHFLPRDPDCFCVCCKPLGLLQGWVLYHILPNSHNLAFPLSKYSEKMYFPTRLDKIIMSLISGQLMPWNPEFFPDFNPYEKDVPGGRVDLYLSPNSAVINDQRAAVDGQLYRVDTAFQAHVRPESLCWENKINPFVDLATGLLGLRSIANSCFHPTLDEPSQFFVKETDSYIITGLLLKLEEIL